MSAMTCLCNRPGVFRFFEFSRPVTSKLRTVPIFETKQLWSSFVVPYTSIVLKSHLTFHYRFYQLY